MDNEGRQIDLFKVPSLPPPRLKRKVLDEDTYLRAADSIIERDFFPDLENLRDRLDYIDAHETKDVLRLRQLCSKYTGGSKPSNTSRVEDSPATFETPEPRQDPQWTPLRRDGVDEPSEEGEQMDGDDKSQTSEKPRLSLDQFMAKYTSEDNESFDHMMEETEKKFRMKHAWLFEAERRHNECHLPNLALPSSEDSARAELLSITSTENDSRPKQVENWGYQVYNSVMYVPDEPPISREKLIELAKQKPLEISHGNTRFDGNPFPETLSQSTMLEASAAQQIKKEGRIGVDGKELGKETPQINGYNFVGAPSPAPGVDASPFMTWGEVEGTPFQLEGSQTPLVLARGMQGPSYRMQQVPARDRLGHELADKASMKHRDKKGKALSAARNNLNQSPAVSFRAASSSSDRLTRMSPAAQRLLTSKLKVRTTSDRALKASYTPSPRVRLGEATPGGIVTPRLGGTPRTPVTARQRVTGEADLTDNLLQLPRRDNILKTADAHHGRVCAADFF